MKKSFYLLSILAVSAMASGCGSSSDYECSTGKKKCENNTAYTCVRGNWDAGTPCALGCADTVCAQEVIFVCNDNDKKCENKTAYTCAQNSWGKGSACQFGCNGAVCAVAEDVCTSGMKKCEDGREYTCVDSRWNDGSDCTDGCDGSVCKVITRTCTEEMTKCERDILYTCENESWKLDSVCPNGCNGSACAGESGDCIDTAKKCEDNKAYVCSGGKWGSEISCANGCNGDICRAEAGCGVEGAVRCKDSTAQKCSNGIWTTTEYCANGCTDDACSKATQDGLSCVDSETGSRAKEFCEGDYAMWCDNSKWTAVNCHDEFGVDAKCFAGTFDKGTADEQTVSFCYLPCSQEEKDAERSECISDGGGYFSSAKYVCEYHDYGIYSWEETGEVTPCSAGCSNGKCDFVDEKDGQNCDPTKDIAVCKGNVLLICDSDDSKWHATDCEFELGEGAVCTDGYLFDGDSKADFEYACVLPCSDEDKDTTKCVDDDGQSFVLKCSKYAEGKYEWRYSKSCNGGCDGNGCKLLDVLDGTACDAMSDKSFCNGDIRLSCNLDNVWDAVNCADYISLSDNPWAAEKDAATTCGLDACALACNVGAKDEGVCEDGVFYKRTCKSNMTEKSTKGAYYWDVSSEKCMHGCDESGCIKYSESEGLECNPEKDKATCDGSVALNCLKQQDADKYVWTAENCKTTEDDLSCGLFMIDGEYVNSCYKACSDINKLSSSCTENVKSEYICLKDIQGNKLWLDNRTVSCEHGCQEDDCKKLDEVEYTACNGDDSYCKNDHLYSCDFDESVRGSIWHVSECSENTVCASVEGKSGCVDACTADKLNEHKTLCDGDSSVVYQCVKSENDKYIWSEAAIVTCEHGCDNGSCKKLDDKEYTSCDLDRDSASCKDGKLYYCDDSDSLWHVAECASDEVCAVDALMGVGCFEKCTEINAKTETCRDGFYQSSQCQDNGSGQGYLVEDSYSCLNGCNNDGKSCNKKHEIEYSVCNPDTDTAFCSNIYQIYCDEYSARWMVDECSGENESCFTSNYDLFCAVKCSEAEISSLKPVCDGNELTGKVCVKDNNNHYYKTQFNQFCMHGCANDACIFLSELEGQSCDSTEKKDVCDGSYRLQCIEDVLTLNADCGLLDSELLCSLNEDDKAVCLSGQIELNPVPLQQDDYACYYEFAEYCNDGSAVYCSDGFRVEDDCSTHDTDDVHYSCAVRLDASGKNRAECIVVDETNKCLESEIGQVKTRCGVSEDGFEMARLEHCYGYAKAGGYWYEDEVKFCSGSCGTDCTETLCSASSAKCEGNVLIQCGTLFNEDGNSIYSAFDCAKVGAVCESDGEDAYCVWNVDV